MGYYSVMPSARIIDEQNPFIKIERAGRTCYKSESPFNGESGEDFFAGLVKRNHVAMLEHATFVFEAKGYDARNFAERLRAVSSYISVTVCGCLPYQTATSGGNTRILISGNLRALNECGSFRVAEALYNMCPKLAYFPGTKESTPIDNYLNVSITPVNLSDLEDLTEDETKAHFYTTFHMVTDRGVSHELVRHRPPAWAQESTRFCNFSKKKFGGKITVVKPSWFDDSPTTPAKTFLAKALYKVAVTVCQWSYLGMIKLGLQAQHARCVLQNTLKTEVVMTANHMEYQHFFNLRYHGTTGNPHPDMKALTSIMFPLYMERLTSFTEPKPQE